MDSVTITGITHGGDGVGRLADGMAVFIPGALPDEVVTVDVHDRRKRFAFGRLVEVTSPSADRIAAPCPHVADGCGGCDLQHASASAQQQLKTRIVTEQLARIGGLESPPVSTCLAAGPAFGYRNRARLHIEQTPGGQHVGFHRIGSHDVVEVDPCAVLAPLASELLSEFRHTTGLTGLEVRGHDRTGARAVILDAGPGGMSIPDGETPVLLRQPDGESVAFRGESELAEEVAGRTYRFDASCFFQANTAGADVLVEQVLKAAGDLTGALTWDLYGGVGLLSLPLAAAGAEVIAVEGHKASARWCATNADDSRLGIDVRDESVAKFLKDVTPEDAPDVVVLDPPRVGAGVEVVDGIAKAGPGTVVYVACDVAALARDVKAFAKHGFQLRHAQPLDMFAQTHHIEIVAVLSR